MPSKKNNQSINKILIIINEFIEYNEFFAESLRHGLFEQLQHEDAVLVKNDLLKIKRSIESKHDESAIVEETKDFLKKRWDLIKGTFLSYTHLPEYYVTQSCIKLAEVLHANEPSIKKVQYLMPTVTCIYETLGLLEEENIDEYNLGCLILSDDMTGLIPVNILSYIIPGQISLDQLSLPYGENKGDRTPPLSACEKQRLVSHSEHTHNFYTLVQEMERCQHESPSFGGHLKKLITALENGGVHRNGEELHAGLDAYSGIVEFMEYWNSLEQVERDELGALKPAYGNKSLQDILNLLTQNNRVDHRYEVIYCTEINASKLGQILSENPDLNKFNPYYVKLYKKYCDYKKYLEIGCIGVDDLSTSSLNKGLIQTSFLHLYAKEINDGGIQEYYERQVDDNKQAPELVSLIVRAFLSSTNCSEDLLYKRNKRREPILLWAFRNKLSHIAEAILENEYGCKRLFLQQNPLGDNILHVAINKELFDEVDRILAHPDCSSAIFLQRDFSGDTPLLLAIKKKLRHVVKKILESQHCSTELLLQQDNNGNTPLHWAMRNELSYIYMILNHRCCSKEIFLRQDFCRNTPLHWAIRLRLWNVVDRILDRKNCSKELLLVQDGLGQNALMLAIGSQKSYVIHAILQCSSFSKKLLRQQDHEGRNVLMWAVNTQNILIIRQVLDAPSASSHLLQDKDFQGDTVLSWAMKKQRLDIFELILGCKHCSGELLIQKDNQGDTVLMGAVKRKRFNYVKALLDSPHCSEQVLLQSDLEGDTILSWAIKNKQFDLIPLILNNKFCSKEVLLIQSDKNIDSIFIFAVENELQCTIEFLLNGDLGSKKLLLSQNRNGNNALILALEMGKFDIVKAILTSRYCSEEMLKQENNDGRSFLECLVFTDRVDILELFLSSPFCTFDVLMPYEMLGEIKTFINSELDQMINDKISSLAPERNYERAGGLYNFFSTKITNLAANVGLPKIPGFY